MFSNWSKFLTTPNMTKSNIKIDILNVVTGHSFRKTQAQRLKEFKEINIFTSVLPST